MDYVALFSPIIYRKNILYKKQYFLVILLSILYIMIEVSNYYKNYNYLELFQYLKKEILNKIVYLFNSFSSKLYKNIRDYKSFENFLEMQIKELYEQSKETYEDLFEKVLNILKEVYCNDLLKKRVSFLTTKRLFNKIVKLKECFIDERNLELCLREICKKKGKNKTNRGKQKKIIDFLK